MFEQAPVIHLDKPRTLRYSMRALRLAEEGAKRNLGEMLITQVGISSVAWMIWAALLHDDAKFRARQDPDLLVEDVCDLLDEHWFKKGRTLKELEPLYSAAIVQAGIFSKAPVGKAVPEAEPEPPASGSQTGSPTQS